ncbi:hypothetical protein ACIRJS_44990 [Streptomyces sp. NPDC102340]|uniref:hypothetical protein n=1 Tax=unclassified Streptomyces TaxID=2593676 RepID=UPI003828F6FF
MLAADARYQTAWLDKYRLETDDLALDYENAQSAIAVVAETGRIDVAMESRLVRIDAILGAMSGAEQTSRWTYEALTADAGWFKVRQLAREALAELADTWQQPLPTLGIHGGPQQPPGPGSGPSEPALTYDDNQPGKGWPPPHSLRAVPDSCQVDRGAMENGRHEVGGDERRQGAPSQARRPTPPSSTELPKLMFSADRF